MADNSGIGKGQGGGRELQIFCDETPGPGLDRVTRDQIEQDCGHEEAEEEGMSESPVHY